MRRLGAYSYTFAPKTGRSPADHHGNSVCHLKEIDTNPKDLFIDEQIINMKSIATKYED